MKTNDLWGLVDMSRYLTNHAVWPTLVPSLGKSDPQVHSEKCTMCALSLTMRFGDVPACDWKNWLFVRGESEEEILQQREKK